MNGVASAAGRGQAIAPTMDDSSISIRRHSRGDGLSSDNGEGVAGEWAI